MDSCAARHGGPSAPTVGRRTPGSRAGALEEQPGQRRGSSPRAGGQGGFRLPEHEPEATHELQIDGPAPSVGRPSDRGMGVFLAERRAGEPQPRVGIPGDGPSVRLSSCRHRWGFLLLWLIGRVDRKPAQPFSVTGRRPLARLGQRGEREPAEADIVALAGDDEPLHPGFRAANTGNRWQAVGPRAALTASVVGV